MPNALLEPMEACCRYGQTIIDFLSDYEMAQSNCRKFTKCREAKQRKHSLDLSSVLVQFYTQNSEKHTEKGS